MPKEMATLQYNLRTREYHSLERMMNAIERTPLYKNALQRLKINWIGLKLNPSLILGMLEGRKEDEKRK